MNMRMALWTLILAGCATAPATRTLGSVLAGGYGARPVRYQVQPGRVVGGQLDVRMDGDCARGTLGATPIVLCKDGDYWNGPSGSLLVREDGGAVKVQGILQLSAGAETPVNGTFPLGQGPQWDELRAHPVLLALTALDSDAQAPLRY